MGHSCAGVLSNREGVTVDLLTNRPEKWNRTFRLNLPDGSRLTGKLNTITNDPARVIPDADWVFLCLPAFLVERTILQIRPFLQPNTVVGSVVGYTGFFLYCHQHLAPNCKLFTFQRVPYVSRELDQRCIFQNDLLA